MAEKGKIENLTRRRESIVEILDQIDKELADLKSGKKADASSKGDDAKKGDKAGAKADAPKEKAPAKP